MSEARFHVLREQALCGAAERLTPGKAGRPRKTRTPSASELDRLREENATLREALWAAEAREEIALTLPHLLRGRGKKIGR